MFIRKKERKKEGKGAISEKQMFLMPGEGQGWGWGEDGQYGAGEGEGHHDPIGSHALHVGGQPNQHH
jgi:hypothetical protein